jgi:hypothetical protein
MLVLGGGREGYNSERKSCKFYSTPNPMTQLLLLKNVYEHESTFKGESRTHILKHPQRAGKAFFAFRNTYYRRPSLVTNITKVNVCKIAQFDVKDRAEMQK